MPKIPDEIVKLRQQVEATDLPPFVREKLKIQLERLSRLTGNEFTIEADRATHWIDWILSLPWRERHQDRLDLKAAKQILDQNHHGLSDVKERILEYLSVLKLKKSQPPEASINNQKTSEQFRAPILLLVGLVGTGKTTLAFSIAEALGRPIARIPFGGMGSARDLRGQSRLHLEAEPGQVIKKIRQAKVKNPIMLLDEIDRIALEAQHDVMGVLVELLDPEQNQAFLDHYLDVPFDLSEVLFITTANNTGNIATAVMDRLEPISMPSYSDADKIIIGKQYLMPRIIQDTGLPPGTLTIDNNVWPRLVRPLGYDAGMRTLQRTIQGLARKTAKAIITGEPGIHLTSDNLHQYVKTW